MPNVCSAYNCTNRSSRTIGISYFKFPLKNKELTKRWVINMRRDKWYPSRFSCLCSEHFEDRFMFASGERRLLLAKAIPTIFSFPDHLQNPKVTAIRVRKKLKMIEESFEVNPSSNQRAQTENNTVHIDHTYCLPSPKIQICDSLQDGNEKLRQQYKPIQSDELITNHESTTTNLNQRNEMGEIWSKLKSEVKNLTDKLGEMEKRVHQFLRHK